MSNEVMTFQSNAPATQRNAMSEMVTSRQAQESQMAMIVAQRFPRDTNASYNRIMQACHRPGLARRAMYEYPRGGERVTGPSIRLAEAMAQNWGNLDFGVVELEQKSGESTVMSYCWDLETNVRQTKIFTVPHVRHTKNGAKVLTDPRDIYELVANQGARRLRACILGIIPGDVIEDAISTCVQTLQGGSKTPLVDRVRKMIGVFQEELGVPQESLEKYIGCKSSAFTEQSIVKLLGVYNAIKEGRIDRESCFELPSADRLEAPASGEALAEGKDTAKGNKTAENGAEPAEVVNLNDI